MVVNKFFFLKKQQKTVIKRLYYMTNIHLSTVIHIIFTSILIFHSPADQLDL
jgi:hypothetical protein